MFADCPLTINLQVYADDTKLEDMPKLWSVIGGDTRKLDDVIEDAVEILNKITGVCDKQPDISPAKKKLANRIKKEEEKLAKLKLMMEAPEDDEDDEDDEDKDDAKAPEVSKPSTED